MKNITKSALIVIDMERGFIDKESAHCIAQAEATIPACIRATEITRAKGIPVFFRETPLPQNNRVARLLDFRRCIERSFRNRVCPE